MPTATPTPIPSPTPGEIPVVQELAGVTMMGTAQEASTSLTVTAQDVTFPATQLTGDLLTVNGTTPAWVAEDTSGLGEGWHLTVAATDFVNGTHIIPKEGLAMRLLDSDVVVLSGNTQPSATAPFATFISIGTPQTFASAGVGEGMGSYSLLPTFQLSVPAQSYAGTYVSTITVTMIAGP